MRHSSCSFCASASLALTDVTPANAGLYTVVVSNPVNGAYLVWVGRVNPTTPVTGTLTVVPGTGAKPPVLKKP